MKILIDASVCSKGGGVQVALSLIKNIISDSEFEVIFVSSPQIDSQLTDEQKSKIKYYYSEINENIFGKRRQGKRLKSIEEKHNPDLVFVVFGPSYWRPRAKTLQGFALPLMVYPKTRNRVYKNNKILFFYQKLLNSFKAKLVRQNSDYIVVETSAFKQRVHDCLGIDLNKIFVVENSFNSNFLTSSNAIKKQSENINIFIPTAYYPHKNLEILVDTAVALLEKKKNNIKFNFLIDEANDAWKVIISDAKSKGVDHYFYTSGPVKNSKMVELYSNTDFVLLPTLAEASTAVYPESFISQKVLLTSKVDFAIELCGDAAVYFDPYDASDIAEKIISTIDDPILQQKLIEKGLMQIQKSYLTPEEKWFKQKDLILRLVNESF
ncbi:glycosyltransferase [Acinetobacter gerneri]|uniref:glycosyltransferase n=1 Tax=Acinetobacter gerneri TaxID=202952 RepID=UPI003AF58877